MTKLNQTKNRDLPESNRTRVIEALNARLSDTLDLVLQSKQAHWNLKGPSFIALHELLDEIADRLREQGDTMAERAVALGGIAEGTLQVVSERTSIPPLPVDLQAQNPLVDRLTDAFAKHAAQLREAIRTAEAADDADTADVFTEVSREVDKDLWFLEAHLARFE
ncbi:MAG: DNA starvation/stationary phase protection protein Dps [Myxococcota bacterium]